jgi:hypothetical protein
VLAYCACSIDLLMPLLTGADWRGAVEAEREKRFDEIWEQNAAALMNAKGRAACSNCAVSTIRLHSGETSTMTHRWKPTALIASALSLWAVESPRAQDAAQLLVRRTAAECLAGSTDPRINKEAPLASNERINEVCWCFARTLISKLTAPEIRAQLAAPGRVIIPDSDPRMQASADECVPPGR